MSQSPNKQLASIMEALSVAYKNVLEVSQLHEQGLVDEQSIRVVRQSFSKFSSDIYDLTKKITQRSYAVKKAEIKRQLYKMNGIQLESEAVNTKKRRARKRKAA